MHDVIDLIASFVIGYRLAGGDPSELQSAALAAHPTATPSDYARGLIRANARTCAARYEEAARG